MSGVYFIIAMLVGLMVMIAIKKDRPLVRMLVSAWVSAAAIGAANHIRTLEARPDLASFGPLDPWMPAVYTATETLLPPEQYRGDVRVIVEFVDEDEVVRRCGGNPAIQACQFGETMVLPNPCIWANLISGKVQYYPGISCHEVGHVNGWRHPQ